MASCHGKNEEFLWYILLRVEVYGLKLPENEPNREEVVCCTWERIEKQ